jgi:hypothetical protein
MVILDGPVNRLASEIIFFAGNLKPKDFVGSVGEEVLQIGHLARSAAIGDQRRKHQSENCMKH